MLLLPIKGIIHLNSSYNEIQIKFGSNINIQGRDSIIIGDLLDRFIYYSTSNLTSGNNKNK